MHSRRFTLEFIRRLVFVFIFLATAWWMFARVKPFIALEKIIFHDVWAQWAIFHILNRLIFAGEIPGWDYFTNSGQPLWPNLEILSSSLDPVPLLAWAFCRWAGLGTLAAYQGTCVLWLAIFAAGGSVLSRRLADHFLVGLTVFLILFQGPLWFALPGQVGGFLIPFRYLPWIILCLVRFIERPSFINAVLLAFVAMIGSSGYVTGFACIAAGAFLVPYLMVLIACGWRPQPRHIVLSGVVAVPAIVGILPVIIATFEIYQNNVVVAREVVRVGYEFNANELATGLIVGLDPLRQWHGSTTIGISAFLLALVAVAAATFELAQVWVRADVFKLTHREAVSSEAGAAALTPGLIGCALISAVLACNLFGTLSFLRGSTDNGVPLLGLRNWGFMITPLILSLTLLAAGGVGILANVKPGPKSTVLLALAIAAIAFLGLSAMVGQLPRSLGGNFIEQIGCHYTPDSCDSFGLIKRAVAERWIAMATLPFLVAMLVLNLPRRLAAHLNLIIGRRFRLGIIAAAFLVATICHLLQPEFASPGWPADEQILDRQPSMQAPAGTSPSHRVTEFNLIDHFPFYFIGPFIWGDAVGFIRPGIDQYPQVTNKMWHLGVHQTYLFALRRYHAVLAAIPPGRKRDILLAVDGEIVRAAASECHRSFDDVIRRIGELSEEQLKTTVIIEADPFALVGCRTAVNGSIGTAQTNIIGQDMEIIVDAVASGFVLISESFSHQWRAILNGKEQKIYPAQGYAMAVPISAGRSVIYLRYEVPVYTMAYLLRVYFLCAIVGLLIGLGLFRLKALLALPKGDVRARIRRLQT